MLQLQPGPSYQDKQHLRDGLINAVKHERWANRLAAMSTTDLLSTQKALARVITAEEDYTKSLKSYKQTAALIIDVNFNAKNIQ